MKNDKSEILILRFFSGTISPEEMKSLNTWLDESDENLHVFNRLKNIWDASNPAFDPSSIDIHSAKNKVLFQIKKEKQIVRRRTIIQLWQRVAAIIVLPLLVYSIFIWSRYKNIEKSNYVTQEVVAPIGIMSTIQLSDGSLVKLNSGSKLKYPAVFDNDQRIVELDGEAYFEVESDKKKHPFIVKTGQITVTATGTEFNVEAYSIDSIVAVTLTEGVVDVSWDELHVELKPKERIVYDKRTKIHNIYISDPYKWHAWKDGVMAFRNDPLDYVFKCLGQSYNVEFIVSSEIKDYTYYATFEDESLDEILSLLEKSAPIKYTRTRDESGQKQIITVSRK